MPWENCQATPVRADQEERTVIRIAIIGNGGMAHDHASKFRAIRGVKLTACCDIIEARARGFSERFGIPAVYTDYRELLAREEIDAVSVVTPDDVHAPSALAAVNKGLATLCEKPFALSLKDARKVRDAARKRGIPNMVNFSKRNAPCLEAAARFIARGGVGELRYVEASYLQNWLPLGAWEEQSAWLWRMTTRHSMGVLGDLGAHSLDMLMLLCGPLRCVSCTLGRCDKGVKGNRIGEYTLDANDNCVASLTLAGGATGVLHCSRWAVAHANREYIHVSGTKGAVEVDLAADAKCYRFYPANAEPWRPVPCKTIPCKAAPTMQQRFVRWIKTGKADPCDFANAAAVQACLEACMKSAEEKRPVNVRG